jgi:hypothetical protein
MTIAHQVLFTRRDYFDNYGYFDSQLKLSMDYELLLRSVPDLFPVWFDYTIARMREGSASRKNKIATMIEAASVQVRHGIRSPLTAYLLSFIFISGMSIRSFLELLGIRISARF